MFNKSSLVLAGMIASTMFGISTYANGFQLPGTSAEAIALGGATVARQDLISNAFHNPAALGLNERDGALQINLGIANWHSEVRSEDLSGTSNASNALASLFFSKRIAQNTVFTFSITSPFNTQTKWEDDELYYALETDLQAYYYSPSLVYNLNDSIAIAIGADIVSAYASGGIGDINADGMGYGFGWHASAFVRLNEFITMGAKYQSSVLVNIDGDIDGNIEGDGFSDLAGTDIRLPQSINFGISTTYFTDFILSAEVVWTDWSSHNNLSIDVNNNESIDFERNWKPATSFRFGAEYLVNKNWRLRLGYAYNNSPVPDHTRLESFVGDDSHDFSCGFGYRQDNWEINAGYLFRLIDNNTDQFGSEYHRNYSQLFQVGATYYF